MITANPHADYERMADNAEATAQRVEAEQTQQHADICTQVRAAILSGEPFTRVTHVSIAGKLVHVCVSEVWDDQMFDCNGDLFRLLRAVIERLDVCGEVLL